MQTSNTGIYFQLYMLQVAPENVLKGEPFPHWIEIYYYLSHGPTTGPDMGYSFSTRQRYIFYLRKVAGKWRLACDYYKNCVSQVLTGTHPSFQQHSDIPLADDVADILFTRGEYDVSDGKMVDALEDEHYGEIYRYKVIAPPFPAKETYTPKFTAILQQMAETETPPVRATACMLLHQQDLSCSKQTTPSKDNLQKP